LQKSKEIQGLRAISVLLVLFYHVDWIPGGYVGVDIFYVISGYLITQIIINDEDFSFKKFYSRRAKRLLPAAYLVLFMSALAFWLIAPALSRVQFSKDLFSSTWYISNYNFAFWQNDYQNLGAEPSPLIHYWSLAVEEQFYLFWPLLLMTFRRWRRSTILLITISSFLLSLILLQYLPIWSFYSLPTRAFELGIGAVIAIYNVSFRSRTLSLLGLLAILYASFWFDANTAFPGFPALIPTLAAALIVANRSRNFLLAHRFSQLLGDRSYSIYLWHWPILIFPTLTLGRTLELREKVIALLATIFLAHFSYKFVEDPIRRSNFTPAQILQGIVLVGMVLSLISLAFYLSGKSVAQSKAIIDIRQQPAIYEDGCQLDKQEILPDAKCVYGDTMSQRSIVLTGDSHAAQWFPAIDNWARTRDYKLIVMTKSSCPASILPLKDRGAFKAKACNLFRANAVKEINKIKPELVIVGSAENHKEVPRSAYNLLPNLNFPGAKILILKDTPWPNRDIPVCLSGNPSGEKCATKPPIGIEYSGRDTFDPIPYLCTDGSCPARLGKDKEIVVYRDHSHISVAMALDLADELGLKLDEVMAR
jgi:peptidoglycan/LPS O-acetylase OafA/YrhL